MPEATTTTTETRPSDARAERRERRRSARGKPLLPLWAALLASVAGGIVLDLAFPAVGIWPLAFVGIAIALVTLIGRSAGGALLVGLVFGAAFYFTHIVWITRYLGPLPWFGLAGIQTVFWAAGSILITLAYRWFERAWPGIRPRLIVLPLLIAGLWTSRELFMGSWPYTGFPWGRMGMSQSESPLAQLSSWTGVAGLTFLMVALSATVVEVFRARRQRDLRAWIPSGAIALILLLTPQWATTDAGSMRVGSVQGNGPAGYFDERERYAVMQAQLAATEPLFGEDLDLLVWPEGGIDADPTRDQTAADVVRSLTRMFDAPVLVNAAVTRGDDIFNSSLLWEPGVGEPVAHHDKRNPVPMGEYVPDRWFFEAIVPDLIALIGREYTPGTNSPVITIDGVGAALAICFDVLYDDLIWEGAAGGAQVYLLQTNNADFRDTDENLQQLAFARMRAIETGRSVVNVSTVGTSQVIAPDGTTIEEVAEDEAAAMLTDVPLRTGLTPAVVIGPSVSAMLLWVPPIALAAVWLASAVRRRRR